MTDYVDFYIKKLAQLNGGTICGGFKDPDGKFYGLQVEKEGDKYNLWILSDDEGNSPGSFEIDKQTSVVG